MNWDSSPETMGHLRAAIRPITAPYPLREVLEAHFSNDCKNLPIAGGWGYSQAEAIEFIRKEFPGAEYLPQLPFVRMEYFIAEKIIYEELIISKPRGRGFSGVRIDRQGQWLIGENSRSFDKLCFHIQCFSDHHWEQLKAEWEQNDFGKKPGFDFARHVEKRQAVLIQYEREFWFDISDVFGSSVASKAADAECRFTAQQITAILNEQKTGASEKELCRKYEISRATLSNWRLQFGG